MGEVWRARDTRLDRDVAVKVLPEEVASDPDALARFEREAKAVAALSHPNILSIFDFGEAGGVAYAVMELLEGETLRARLAQGPISQKQAVDCALQVARGLSAAHERGVIHRDLKPENLFITKDGHVKILDFGLAKRAEQVRHEEVTSAPTEEQHTQPGTVLGTMGYMSPEQVRGLAVDQRSDIFSFGAVLYEMLSGKRAFAGATPADTMSAILKEEPPELLESGRAISPALDHIVRHCLEKERENRFQSARDIAFALSESSVPVVVGAVPVKRMTGKRSLRITAGVVAVLAIAGLLLLRRIPRGGEAGGVKRVAVLPFENLGSPEDDYFADGIADAVRGKLTSLRGVEVIARASSVAYKKTAKTPAQIARELDAPYLLTATVRWEKSGGTSRVQVSPELVQVGEASAPASRWQQPFDAALTDVFQVQSDIASRVAEALGVALGAREEKELSRKPTQNLAAYEAFLKGEEIWRMGGSWSNLVRAMSFYEQAVALDPGFAQGWARLSEAASHHFDASPTPELGEKSRGAAEKAIALAPDSSEGYLALGNYLVWVRWDETGALEQFEKAQRLAPGNSEVLMARTGMEGRLGRLKAVEEHIRQAERLDPRSIEPKIFLASQLNRLGRHAEARQALDSALALAPASIRVIQQKVYTYLLEGDLAAARAVIKAAPKETSPTALIAYVATFGDLVWVLDEEQRELLLRLPPDEFESAVARDMALVQAYALKGDAANVRAYAEDARASLENSLRVIPYHVENRAILGLALAYLGRKGDAIREGERAVALRPLAKNAFDGPYYQHLLARIDILVGEQEKALDNLETLLKTPTDEISTSWLRIDPTFDPLRKNPRFQKLIAGGK